MPQALQSFCIVPDAYRHISRLINAFYGVYPDVAREFVKTPKISGRIAVSLNSDDWVNKTLEVKYLVMAIYRASPSVWLKILARLTVSMGGLDLANLYKKVEESVTSDLPESE